MFDLTELAKLGRARMGEHRERPCLPVAVGVCLTLWMLRGLEGASLLGEQAVIGEAKGWATLDLGPTKVGVKGTGCRPVDAHCLALAPTELNTGSGPRNCARSRHSMKS